MGMVYYLVTKETLGSFPPQYLLGGIRGGTAVNGELIAIDYSGAGDGVRWGEPTYCCNLKKIII